MWVVTKVNRKLDKKNRLNIPSEILKLIKHKEFQVILKSNGTIILKKVKGIK